jgi:2-polyprenyl-3-methyl-5-hydroxy-6-metoxy-1,4-benzoquinol methylase
MIIDATKNRSNPSILDVGCGVGTVYGLIKHLEPNYKGLDLSDSAIAHCKRSFGRAQGLSWEVAPFEDFSSVQPYDVVILNEVLYYFRLSQILGIVKKSLSLVKKGTGTLIISMSGSPKSILVWLILRAFLKPVRTVSVRAGFGRTWKVAAFAPRA